MTKPYRLVCDTTNREEWLEARKPYVGASEQLGLSKAKAKAGLTEPFTGNRHTFFGQLLELPAATGFGTWSGMEVTPLGHKDGKPRHTVYASTIYPHMSATLDGYCRVPDSDKGKEKLERFLKKDMGMVDDLDIFSILNDKEPAILEIKTPGWWKLNEWGILDDKGKWERGFDDPATELPKAYYTQVQHQMAVMGANTAWLLALCGGKRFIAYRLERDEVAISDRVAKCAAFMEKVKELKNDHGQ